MHASFVPVSGVPGERRQITAADLVLSLGTPDFEHLLMRCLRDLSEADLCSAFTVGRSGSMEYLLSCGDAVVSDDTACEVSISYARSLWRQDPILQDVLASAWSGASPALRHLSTKALIDRSYRNLHLRNGVMERVSFYRPHGDELLILSIYRRQGHGSFDAVHVERFGAEGDFLLALVTQHRRLVAAGADAARHPPIDRLATRFIECGAGLSQREAQACAMIVAGCTSKDIARAAGVSTTTVATYRKRAYSKLRVSDRRSLQRLYDRIAS